MKATLTLVIGNVTSRWAGLGGLCLGASLASCMPSNARDVAVIRQQPASRSAPAAEGARSSLPEVPASARTQGPDDAVPIPSQPADSAIPPNARIISERAGSGLVAFAEEMPGPGSLWVGPLDGNGGRDVLVYIPPHPDSGAQVRLVYHFHGTYSEHIEKKRSGLPKKKWVGWNRLQQTLEAATELQEKREYNVALVYPISAGKRPEPGHRGWFNKAYDRMWMRSADSPEYRDSFDTLHDEVLQILREQLGVHPSKLGAPVVAEGHSAGGIALLNIAVAGTRYVGEYIFQDAGFQSWADGCYEAVQASTSGALVTLVITDGGIADPFGRRDPWCSELEADAAAWDRHERWCRDQTGRPPPGNHKPCEALMVASEQWEDYETWCEGMKEDMRNTPGIYVHRTRVYHGEQPRHFTGGLELPEDCLQALQRSSGR